MKVHYIARRVSVIALLGAVLASATPSTTRASGILVADVASLTQMIDDGIKRAQEFKQNMDAARGRLKEMQRQGSHYKDMVDGHYNFEDLLNDPLVNSFMNQDDWRDISEGSQDVSAMRREYGMTSTNPELQAHYDSLLREQKLKEKMYETTTARSNKMRQLMVQFENATNPAAKADIANALRFEQVQVQNDGQMLKNLTALMKQKRALKHENKMRDKLNAQFGEGVAPPPRS